MLLTILACATTPPALVDDRSLEPRIWGLEVRVPEIEPAVRFYRDALAFEPAGFVGQERALLRLDGLHLVLARADGDAPPLEEAHVYVNFQAADLDAAAARVLDAGGAADAVEPFPLGTFLRGRDPWGNPFHVLHVTAGEPFEGASGVFNVGWDSTSYEQQEAFLAALGFRVSTRDYLPTALPWEEAGASYLVGHAYATADASSAGRRNALLLEVADLAPAREALAALSPDAIRPSAFGRTTTVRSPAGVEVRLVERSPAQLAFERFRALEGAWTGASTQGWEARMEIEVIARGTTVIQRSSFEAHPNEAMLTAYHRDGADLVLTHYCVAGNQPRLVARDFGDDGLTFVWRDGTNLASRDEGHMDSVRYGFPAENELTARWSWYENGSEGWMEEIRYRRAAPATREAATVR